MTAAPRSTESFSYAPTRLRLPHAPSAVSPRCRPGDPALRGDQAGLVRVDHGLDTVAQAELGHDVADVSLDRGLGDVPERGDLGVGQSGALDSPGPTSAST